MVGLVGVWTFRGTNDHGGKTWLADWDWVALKDGRQVYVVYDSDVMLKEPVRLALDRIGAALSRIGARVGLVYLPSGEGGAKVGADDYLAQGHRLDELVALASTTMRKPAPAAAPAKPVEEVPPVKLGDAIATFRRWLYLPDPELLYVLWGAVAANRLPGDPVWLVLVDVSGGGKTEAIRACGDLPECAHIGALTEAGLLSGTPSAERAESATGGVLRIIGARGVIVAKDFTSVLAMEKDSRGRVLAALREIYDGRWQRQLGTDGGRELAWEGKAGFVAGVTHEIDRHYAVMARMGERLLLWRTPERADKAVDKTVDRALGNQAGVERMRAELRRAALGVFAGLPKTPAERKPAADERTWLIELAKFVARGRAGVITDYKGDLIDVVPPELPTRLAMELEGLLAGMDYIGVPRQAGIRAMTNTGLGCIPAARRRMLDHLAEHGAQHTSEITDATGIANRSAVRALDAAAAHRLVIREATKGGNKGHRWELTDDAAATLKRAAEKTSTSVPHMSSGIPGEQDTGCSPEIPDHIHNGDVDTHLADEDEVLQRGAASSIRSSHDQNTASRTTRPARGGQHDNHRSPPRATARAAHHEAGRRAAAHEPSMGPTQGRHRRAARRPARPAHAVRHPRRTSPDRAEQGRVTDASVVVYPHAARSLHRDTGDRDCRRRDRDHRLHHRRGQRRA